MPSKQAHQNFDAYWCKVTNTSEMLVLLCLRITSWSRAKLYESMFQTKLDKIFSNQYTFMIRK